MCNNDLEHQITFCKPLFTVVVHLEKHIESIHFLHELSVLTVLLLVARAQLQNALPIQGIGERSSICCLMLTACDFLLMQLGQSVLGAHCSW